MPILRSSRPIAAVVISILLSTASVALPEAPALKAAPPCEAAVAASPDVKAASAVLMDLDTGAVLYSRNPHMRLPNASTTKIMTAILVIEHCKMTDTITASKNASETPFTSLHLKPGETITVKDLLTALLVRSANDAAVAAAEHIAGSTAKFADMMNRKARRIGCTDTHFVNPNGLYDPKHYTSAHDLCLMARYALRYPAFDEAVRTRKYFVESRSMNKKDMCVFSHSPFLRDYPGADGIKSGYTREAKRCFVGSATRSGWRLVSAVLSSPNASVDTAALMDHGFANFQPVSVIKANEKCADAPVLGGWRATVPALVAKDLNVPVPKSGGKITTKAQFAQVEAPILKGAKLGKLKVLVDGKQVATVELRAAQEMGISLARRAWIVMKGCGIIVACLAGGRYGTAIAKGARRRRRRVTSSLRSYNRRG
jgi:D-alanyl-D-alanine carboxypeptidase (penicillin-binding protein 5/6)